MAANTATNTTAKLAEICNILNEVVADVRRNSEWINGNGKPGAKQTLAVLEQRLCEIEKQITKLTGYIGGLIVTVIGALIIQYLLGQ